MKSEKKMKNKKTVLGTILLLFAISGLCNIVNVSAFTDTIYIPSSSYAYYSLGYLESGDQILINEIDSDGGIDVYIMIQWQFDEFKDSGFISSEKMWQDIVLLSGWRIDINTDGDYYVVLVNDALLTGRTVDVDISIDRYTPDPPIDIRPIVALIITIGVISGISVLTILLVKRSKRKKKEAGKQYQEVIKPKYFYCPNCGTENIDITSDYCSKCGSKVLR